MSYRNDHDAALARIDALELELGKNADANKRFNSLEQQLANARAERDRMRDTLASERDRGSAGTVMALVGAAAIVIGGFAFAIHSASRHAKLDDAPVVAVAAPAISMHDAQIAELMACVRQLDSVIASRSASSASCLASIRTQVNDPTLGVDIHRVLQDWYTAESKFSTSDDAVAQRDELVGRIHAYVIPSYTR